MNGRNFDRLTRTFGATSTRRGLVAFAAAFAGLSARSTGAVQLSNGTCGVAGEVCTILIGCCEGLTCATSTINTNYGVCVSGGTGGTMAVTDSIIAPTSDQSSTQMNALAQEIAASAGTSTTTTDPNADQQARRDARQTKRSSRRSTRKSNNTTQQTNRQSRRDTRQLNASPELSLESFTGQGDDEPGAATEIVRVNNLDAATIVLSRASSILDPALVSTLSVTIATGSSYLLESGTNEVEDGEEAAAAPNSAVATIWTEDLVCDGSAGAGYTVTAAQSGATTTYEFDVLCGQIATFANPGSGHNHRQQNQRQQRRRKHRAQRKHKQSDHRGQ